NKSSVKTYTAKIDKTAPTATIEINGTIGNNSWYRSDVTIRTKDVTDGAGSGIISTVLSHTALTSDTDGTAVSLIITDKVGNVYTDKTTIKLDKTNPSCVSSGAPAGWVNTNVTLKGTCSDNMSKCKNVEVSHIFSREGELYEGPGLVYDNAGNSVACPANQLVKIDKTNPTCVSSGAPTDWVNTNVTLKGTCSDDMSKCKDKEVTSVFKNNKSIYEGPGRVYDNAGNFVECKEDQLVLIDKTPPFTPYATSNDVKIEGPGCEGKRSSDCAKHGSGKTSDISCTIKVKMIRNGGDCYIWGPNVNGRDNLSGFKKWHIEGPPIDAPICDVRVTGHCLDIFKYKMEDKAGNIGPTLTVTIDGYLEEGKS
ncbi:MAG: hypothetical protein RR406_02135, partial [Bacilli bacterium]